MLAGMSCRETHQIKEGSDKDQESIKTRKKNGTECSSKEMRLSFDASG